MVQKGRVRKVGRFRGGVETEPGSQSRHSSDEVWETMRSKGRQEDEYEKKTQMKPKRPQVPPEAEQGSDIRSRWEWVETSVWTDRMLEALENGIAGVEETKWFCLIDKVYDEGNLMSAYMKVAKNKGAAGVDHVTVKGYGKQLVKNQNKLHEQLRNGTYSPSRIKRIHIPKPGGSDKRPLGIPIVRDRIVQSALRQVIEPIFERRFAENSYGFRPRRGCKDALRQVDKHLKAGKCYVVDADLRKCFDQIPHERLMQRVSKEIADGRVLKLIRAFLRQEVLEDGEVKRVEESGTPQGAALSPLLCNIYLNPMDHEMVEGGREMIRYADDFVVVCASRQEAEEALETVRRWLEDNGLQLHPDKTRLVDMTIPGAYFDFLGYRFRRTRKGRLAKIPSPKSEKRLREKLKRPTRRANGKSLEEIIVRCNRVLKGWYEYFKHSSKWALKALDGWVRMRLRSILRKRMKRRGRGRGSDHQRWPNAYFAKLGLFSMYTAWEEAASPR